MYSFLEQLQFENKNIMNESIEGFDLGPFLEWLEQSSDMVNTVINGLKTARKDRVCLEIHGKDHIPLSRSEINCVLNRFPASAQARSVAARIRGQPALWFAKGTTAASIKTTPKIEEALSPTAIIPGYTGNIIWTPEAKLQEITLYAIPGVSMKVAKCISAYTLCHEYTHTLLNPLWYNGDKPYVLELPDDGNPPQPMDGVEFLRRFANECNDYDPVSHYAAAYHPLPADPTDPRFFASVSEELCECVAAHLMGFVYRGRRSRALGPLDDRPPVQWMVERFLRATLQA